MIDGEVEPKMLTRPAQLKTNFLFLLVIEFLNGDF